jgi:hypothetical protein
MGIQSIDHLLDILNRHGISTEKWSKSPAHLFREISQNECELVKENETLIRKVRVAVIEVYHRIEEGILTLYEEKQIFCNGDIRSRGFDHISEKLRDGETPIRGALRGSREELSVEVKSPQLIEKGNNTVISLSSSSYPGLTTRYELFSFECYLTPDQFREEYIEKTLEKDTYFRWRSSSQEPIDRW